MFGRKKLAAPEAGPLTEAAEPAAEARIRTADLNGEPETVPAADQDGAKEAAPAADQDEAKEAAPAADQAGEPETGPEAAPDDESDKKNRAWPAGLVLTVLGIAGLWAGVWLLGRTRRVRLLFASVFVGRIARYYWIALLIGAVLLIAGVLLLRQAMRARPAGGKERGAKERSAAGTAEPEQERAQAESELGKAQTEPGQENVQAKPKKEEAQTEPERMAADNQASSPEPTAQFCPKCGRILAPGAKFCGGCGAPIKDAGSR